MDLLYISTRRSTKMDQFRKIIKKFWNQLDDLHITQPTRKKRV